MTDWGEPRTYGVERPLMGRRIIAVGVEDDSLSPVTRGDQDFAQDGAPHPCSSRAAVRPRRSGWDAVHGVGGLVDGKFSTMVECSFCTGEHLGIPPGRYSRLPQDP
jgi:hypothetical protein